ncbi:PA domain protein [Ostertagia ostertagi]
MMLSFNARFLLLSLALSACWAELNKTELRDRAYEMFMHGYQSYMTYAYPADELMPLSCRGRVRGVTPSRGDVDDSLGNFSLTLIDTLDTLVVVGALDEFERAVKLIVDNVRFDSDLIVSVFETNIRILGGLLSGHLMAELIRGKDPSRLQWYDNGQLLKMAIDIGDRLLPAFNTSSGLPYSRARKAMDFLWGQRHRASDLMGTVLNVHSGDWVRRESGIGAGIDSYYEYCLKAYILLGDKSFLERFERHYEAVMRYVNKGPLFVDVHMHRPTVATRSFMDALLAFWPALQVLKGDVKRAIEMHEMLFQVVQKHKFLPEAFTHDFQVHWAEHPIRPEFIESTYFLYRATKDPHYLEVAKQVMDSINDYVRVPCGFAGVKDVRTMSHEDRMDSFVLSETFKYLYMIFAEPSELIFDPDNYVLTTEAHFLPLNIGNEQSEVPRRMLIHPDDISLSSKEFYVYANPPGANQYPTEAGEALRIRERTQGVLEELFDMQRQQQSSQQPLQCVKPSERLRAWAFSASNAEHIKQLRQMGIDVQVHEDGRMHLSHQTTDAVSPQMAKCGIDFMQEMLQLTSQRENESEIRGFRYVQILSSPYFGYPVFRAAPAQYGADLESSPAEGEVAIAEPLRACSPLTNKDQIRGRIALVERSDCMFQEKSRQAQQAGAIGVIVIDHIIGTSSANEPSFAMAEDKDSPDDIAIPSLFVYYKEGQQLLKAARSGSKVVVRLSSTPLLPNSLVEQFLMSGMLPSVEDNMMCLISEGDFIQIDNEVPSVIFKFRFESVTQESEPHVHQEVVALSKDVSVSCARFSIAFRLQIVERHVTNLQDAVGFNRPGQRAAFFNLMRTAAYGALGLNVQDENLKTVEQALRDAYLLHLPPTIHENLRGDITQVRCLPRAEKVQCVRIAA